MGKIIEEFITWLKTKGYKNNTISNYYILINKFLTYLAKNKVNFLNFSEKNFLDFIAGFSTEDAGQTKNSYIYAILKYCDFLNEAKDIKIEIKNKPLEKAEKKIFKHVKNIESLTQAITRSGKETAGRDNLLLTMLYVTGIKTKELIKLKRADIKNDSLNISGKTIKLNKNLLEKIFNFCLKNNIRNDQYLFFSYWSRKKNLDSHITERAAQSIIKNLKEITKSDFSINDLRKSLSASIFLDNIKITSISKHSELSTDKKSYLEF